MSKLPLVDQFLPAIIGPSLALFACTAALAQDGSSFGVTMPFGQNRQESPQVTELTNRAMVLSKSGNNEQAVELLKQAASIDPLSAVVHINLAAIFNELKRSEDAMQESQIAMQLAPTDERPYVTFIDAAIKGNHLKDARSVGQIYLDRFRKGSTRKRIERELANTSGGVKAPPGSPDNYLSLVTPKGKVVWAQSAMPLKVFIYPAGNCKGFMPQYNNILSDAFRSWEIASHGLVRFVPANNPGEANIECRWTDDPRLLPASQEGGDARCQLMNDSLVHAGITLVTYKKELPMTPKVIMFDCLHEIGHAIGIQGHSDSMQDIMYYEVYTSVQNPHVSQRDANTLILLYQQL
jgi:predicted Zn-dependent protease